MKNKLLTKFFTLILISLITVVTVNASPGTAFQNKAANALVKLGIMKGYEDGSLRLENYIKRSEFITLILKAACIEAENNPDSREMSFKDLSSEHWAYYFIKTAWLNGIVSGYPDNTFAPDKEVTLPEALLATIRILGYERELTGSWPDNVISKANELDLCKNLDLPGNKALTRGEAAVIIFNSLTVKLK